MTPYHKRYLAEFCHGVKMCDTSQVIARSEAFVIAAAVPNENPLCITALYSSVRASKACRYVLDLRKMLKVQFLHWKRAQAVQLLREPGNCQCADTANCQSLLVFGSVHDSDMARGLQQRSDHQI